MSAGVEAPPHAEGEEQSQRTVEVVDKDAYENMTVLEQWSDPTRIDLVILFIIGVLVGLISVLTVPVDRLRSCPWLSCGKVKLFTEKSWSL